MSRGAAVTRTTHVRLTLPHHLRNLAGVDKEFLLEVDTTSEAEVSLAAVLAALETRFPMLCGTLRDPTSGKRRPFVRFFACQQDLSHQAMTAPLPDAVVDGRELLIVLGAMAGG